jgi:putative ABC transport system ATP-binding protein
MAESSLIKINSISKNYLRGQEQISVLNGLSLEIGKGEFIALMGPSGSGKTTLLNLIAGLDAPDSGSIAIGGETTSSLSDAALAKWRSRNVGFVFQFYNLIPVLTAAENVALPLNLFNLSQKEQIERAKFALKVVGLEDRADHFPNQLSGGQEQRVAIARAIVTDPTIIVADEPTGDLDRNSATEIMQLLTRLNKEFSKTIIMVTHDQTAAGYASRIVQLDKGRLKEAA